MTIPYQKFYGARRRIQPAPQIRSKKRNLHTEDDEPSRKRNAAKHSKLFDMIQNPSILIPELAQDHTATARTPRAPIAEDDEIAEAEITSHSSPGTTATFQLTQVCTIPAIAIRTPIAEDDEIAEAEITSRSPPGTTATFQLTSELTQACTVPAIAIRTPIVEDNEIAEAEITSRSPPGTTATFQLTSELTQACTVPAIAIRTPIAEDDEIAEAEITSRSPPGNTALFQLSTLATHRDSTAGNPASQTVDKAILATQTRITANQYPVISTVRVQSSKWDISEALTQEGIEALGDQPCSKLTASGISP